MKTYIFKGSTFPYSKTLKGYGCKWDPASKVWHVSFAPGSWLDGYFVNMKLRGVEIELVDGAYGKTAKKEEKAYDNLFNEGAEGFNPYRDHA